MPSALALLLLVVAALQLSGAVAADVSLSVQASTTVHQVSRDLWGVFFEELNHAGEGGMYSQRIQNSAFEVKVHPFPSPHPTTSPHPHHTHAPSVC